MSFNEHIFERQFFIFQRFQNSRSYSLIYLDVLVPKLSLNQFARSIDDKELPPRTSFKSETVIHVTESDTSTIIFWETFWQGFRFQ